MESNKIIAAVLAGGKSSRMGQDKGLMLRRGKPMIQYVLEAINGCQIPAIIVSANAVYSQFGYEVIPDIELNKGPMGGLLSAMESVNATHVLLLSCDMPLITSDIIIHLTSEVEEHSVTVARIKNQLMPLLAVYSLRIKDAVKQRITLNELKMHDLINAVDHKIVSYDNYKSLNSHWYINVNSPADFALLSENGNTNN